MAILADLLRTGYKPPTESPLSDPIKEHFASLPQKFNENQAHQMDLLARAYPGNTFKSNMLEGDPKALAELAMQAPIIGMTAYHGTPHKIKGLFDINKVGTGEGAQAYGHGMYFAENPAVATEYKNMLGSKIDVNGKPLYNANKTIGSTGNTELDDYLVANLGDVKATRKQLLSDIKEIRPTNPVAAKEMQTTLADLRKANVGVQNTGNLYKVDIPDEQIPNMMDYHKPLSEQPKAVQDIAMQYLSGLKNQAKMGGYKSVWDLDGADLYGVMQRYQINDAGKLIKKNVDAKDVSNKLLNSGVPGIKYLDQESLRQTDSYLAKHGGTSNFVVFDPSTVKILEENGKALTRKELIEQQLNKVIE